MPNKQLALSVGFFILISTTLIFLSLLYIVNKKGLFEAHKEYKLIAKDAQNITNGMPILFSGFEIAEVSELGLDDNGEVIITISVPEHNTKWIRRNSRFVLENPLIGKAKITLQSQMQEPILEENIILRIEIKDGINEIISGIQPVISDLQNIVNNINKLSGSLADTNSSFQNSLTHIQRYSKKLASSPSILETLTGNKKSVQDFQATLTNLNLLVKNLNLIAKNTNKGISEIREDIIKPTSSNIYQLEMIFKDLHQKLKTMDKTIQELGSTHKDVKYFKDEMKILLDEINEVSQKINSILGEENHDQVQLP